MVDASSDANTSACRNEIDWDVNAGRRSIAVVRRVMSGDDGPETRDILLQVIAEDERAKRCSDLRATREGQIEGAR